MSPWYAVLLFFTAAAVDVLWTKYTLAVTGKRALRAANFGVLLYLFAAISTVGYVGNRLYLIPVCLGAWLGTFTVLRREARS